MLKHGRFQCSKCVKTSRIERRSYSVKHLFHVPNVQRVNSDNAITKRWLYLDFFLLPGHPTIAPVWCSNVMKYNMKGVGDVLFSELAHWSVESQSDCDLQVAEGSGQKSVKKNNNNKQTSKLYKVLSIPRMKRSRRRPTEAGCLRTKNTCRSLLQRWPGWNTEFEIDRQHAWQAGGDSSLSRFNDRGFMWSSSLPSSFLSLSFYLWAVYFIDSFENVRTASPVTTTVTLAAECLHLCE